MTGMFLSRRMKKKKDNISEDEYEEIRAEIIEVDALMKQARLEKEEASKEREKAEELMRIATEERDRLRTTMCASQNESRSPYDILGVHKNDSLDSIRKVYEKLIAIYHPDKHVATDELSREQKKELSQQIKTAYDWVLNHHPKYES